MDTVQIRMISINPEVYCLLVYEEKVGEGSYAEMVSLGARYDSRFEPNTGWEARAAEVPEEYWARRTRQARARRAVLLMVENRRRAAKVRDESTRAYVASRPDSRPRRVVTGALRIVRRSEDPPSRENQNRSS